MHFFAQTVRMDANLVCDKYFSKKMLFALSKCRLGKFIFDKSPNPHLFAISATQTVDLNPQDFFFFAIFHRTAK